MLQQNIAAFPLSPDDGSILPEMLTIGLQDSLSQNLLNVKPSLVYPITLEDRWASETTLQQPLSNLSCFGCPVHVHVVCFDTAYTTELFFSLTLCFNSPLHK